LGRAINPQSHELNPNSEFVKTALGELKGIPPGIGRPAAKLTAEARTPVEAEVLNALKVSLSASTD